MLLPTMWKTLRQSVVTPFRFLAANNHLDLFPLRKTLSGYNRERFKGDLRASVNVALLAFPQGMAYALIAGLPIQYGLYGSAAAAILAPFFSGSHFITLGPTNATAVLLLSTFIAAGVLTDEERAVLMPIILVMAGIFLIIGAYLRVANLTQYVSRTVVTGYITAAAVLIIANQIENVLGIEVKSYSTNLLGVLKTAFLNLDSIHWPSVALSGLTFLIYYMLNQRFRFLPNVAITLVIMSLVAWAFSLMHLEFKVLSAVNIADFRVTWPTLDFDAISRFSSAALAIALLCTLESSSIGKSLAARAGARLDNNQEMLSAGVANVGCAFLGGMPASGSLTRSVLNWNSGATSPLSSLFNGLIVVLGAFALGPYIAYIPKAALAVLVIIIGVSLINRHAIFIVTHSTRSDTAVFLSTLTAGLLFPLDTAIYFGVGVSIILFLRKASHPELIEYSFNDEGVLAELEDTAARPDPEISIVHVEGNLYFGACEIFRDQIRRVCEDPNLKIMVLKMRNAHHLDASSVMALEELVGYMKERNRVLLISEARKEIIRIFKKSGLLETVGRDNIFPDITQNPVRSTAKAMKRAKEILGGQNATVKIYVSPVKKKQRKNSRGD